MKRYITIIALVTGIFGQLILANPAITNHELSEAVIEKEILYVEEEMAPVLEDWMITGVNAATEQIGTETSYRLEDWMLETNNFNTNAVEDELELEPWMEDASAFIEDTDIEIENWMFVFHR